MNAHVVDIPDDPAELAGWLDRYLVGLDLAELVSELLAIHPDNRPNSEPLETFLGHRLTAVMEHGLSALPRPSLRRLLRHPRRLFELQDRVLLSGGPYWDRIGQASPQQQSLALQGKNKVNALFQSQRSKLELDESGLLILERPWWRRPAVLLTSAAATIALAVIGFQQLSKPSEPPPWGWNKPDALADQGRPDLYLNQLADSAEDWFKRRPEERDALTRRVEQFRQGCSRLIAAPHRPLSSEDRAWLVERCRAWTTKFDAQLEALRSGRSPLQVRDEVDATIRKLIDTLRTKARERSVAFHPTPPPHLSR